MLLRCFKGLLCAPSGACSFGLSSREALAFTRTLGTASSGSLPEKKAGGAQLGMLARLELDPNVVKLHVTNLPFELDKAAVERLFEPFGKVHFSHFLTKLDPNQAKKYIRKRGEGGGG